MDYDAILAHVLDLLQREQRLSYRVLKRRFQLDDEFLEDLKDDLIYAKKLAVDEDGRVLVWTGGTSSAPAIASPVPPPATPDVSPAQSETAPIVPPRPEAERRQLRHGAKIISQFIRPCILVSVHKHFLVNLTHFLKNLAA